MGKTLETILKKSFRAAKCLAMLKLTISRIKLLRNKKTIATKQMRKEIASLLKSGQGTHAYIVKVDTLIKEESTIAAFDLIDQFCHSIINRLPSIETQRNCPIDMKEPIASLIFAAPRCPDLGELMSVREMFMSKYGKDFGAAASELRPECGVSKLLIEKLSTRPATGEMKVKVMKDIAREHNINWTAAQAIIKSPEESKHNAIKQGCTFDKIQSAESTKAGETSLLAHKDASSNIQACLMNSTAYVTSISPNVKPQVSLSSDLSGLQSQEEVECHDVPDEFDDGCGETPCHSESQGEGMDGMAQKLSESKESRGERLQQGGGPAKFVKEEAVIEIAPQDSVGATVDHHLSELKLQEQTSLLKLSKTESPVSMPLSEHGLTDAASEIKRNPVLDSVGSGAHEYLLKHDDSSKESKGFNITKQSSHMRKQEFMTFSNKEESDDDIEGKPFPKSISCLSPNGYAGISEGSPLAVSTEKWASITSMKDSNVTNARNDESTGEMGLLKNDFSDSRPVTSMAKEETSKLGPCLSSKGSNLEESLLALSSRHTSALEASSHVFNSFKHSEGEIVDTQTSALEGSISKKHISSLVSKEQEAFQQDMPDKEENSFYSCMLLERSNPEESLSSKFSRDNLASKTSTTAAYISEEENPFYAWSVEVKMGQEDKSLIQDLELAPKLSIFSHEAMQVEEVDNAMSNRQMSNLGAVVPNPVSVASELDEDLFSPFTKQKLSFDSLSMGSPRIPIQNESVDGNIPKFDDDDGISEEEAYEAPSVGLDEFQLPDAGPLWNRSTPSFSEVVKQPPEEQPMFDEVSEEIVEKIPLVNAMSSNKLYLQEQKVPSIVSQKAHVNTEPTDISYNDSTQLKASDKELHGSYAAIGKPQKQLKWKSKPPKAEEDDSTAEDLNPNVDQVSKSYSVRSRRSTRKELPEDKVQVDEEREQQSKVRSKLQPVSYDNSSVYGGKYKITKILGPIKNKKSMQYDEDVMGVNEEDLCILSSHLDTATMKMDYNHQDHKRPTVKQQVHGAHDVKVVEVAMANKQPLKGVRWQEHDEVMVEVDEEEPCSLVFNSVKHDHHFDETKRPSSALMERQAYEFKGDVEMMTADKQLLTKSEMQQELGDELAELDEEDPRVAPMKRGESRRPLSGFTKTQVNEIGSIQEEEAVTQKKFIQKGAWQQEPGWRPSNVTLVSKGLRSDEENGERRDLDLMHRSVASKHVSEKSGGKAMGLTSVIKTILHDEDAEEACEDCLSHFNDHKKASSTVMVPMKEPYQEVELLQDSHLSNLSVGTGRSRHNRNKKLQKRENTEDEDLHTHSEVENATEEYHARISCCMPGRQNLHEDNDVNEELAWPIYVHKKSGQESDIQIADNKKWSIHTKKQLLGNETSDENAYKRTGARVNKKWSGAFKKQTYEEGDSDDEQLQTQYGQGNMSGWNHTHHSVPNYKLDLEQSRRPSMLLYASKGSSFADEDEEEVVDVGHPKTTQYQVPGFDQKETASTSAIWKYTDAGDYNGRYHPSRRPVVDQSDSTYSQPFAGGNDEEVFQPQHLLKIATEDHNDDANFVHHPWQFETVKEGGVNKSGFGLKSSMPDKTNLSKRKDEKIGKKERSRASKVAHNDQDMSLNFVEDERVADSTLSSLNTVQANAEAPRLKSKVKMDTPHGPLRATSDGVSVPTAIAASIPTVSVSGTISSVSDSIITVSQPLFSKKSPPSKSGPPSNSGPPVLSIASTTPSTSSFTTTLSTTVPPRPLPHHVHPKLPDIDDITARMEALRQARQQANTGSQ